MRKLVSIVALLVLAVGSSASAQTTTVPIAIWNFEPGANFLVDSSGNGNTLVGSAISVLEPDPTIPTSTGSAFFDGSSVLSTVGTLNLFQFNGTQLRNVRFTWSMRLQDPGPARPLRPIMQQTLAPATTAGSFQLVSQSDLAGTTAATQGFLALQPTAGTSTIEVYPHPIGAPAPGGTWVRFLAVMNLDATNPFDVIQVFNITTGTPVLVGTEFGTLPTPVAPAAFINAVLLIGASSLTPVATGFIGNIDEMRIETVFSNVPGPTPGPTPSPSPIPTPINPVNTVGGNGISGANGVLVDPTGVLKLRVASDPYGQLIKRRIGEARVQLNPRVAKQSKLRKVSLNRLEKMARARLAQGQPLTDEMLNLAGLTRARYVFYYPETKDIVLAGPAEGWAPDDSGMMRGIESHRPTLLLQDLIVALRSYAPNSKPEPAILCSIDPTPEGLSRMQQFLRNVGQTISPDDTDMIVDGLRSSLGMQNVRVAGIGPNTHMARVLLECDYRMKLIGIGAEEPPVAIASYVDRATPTSNRSALERWFFIPDYNSARIANDNLALELTGDTVKLVSENQLVARDGNRAATGKSNRASDAFTAGFTAKFPELATRLPVFAQMRNCIDLSIAAAFIQQQDFYGKAGWDAQSFMGETWYPVEVYQAAKQVETVCTAVWKGSTLMTPVGGGVTIHPRDALSSKNAQPDKDGKLGAARESIDLKELPADRWWWD